MKKVTLALSLIAIIGQSCAVKKKAATNENTAPAEGTAVEVKMAKGAETENLIANVNDDFKKTANGLEYRFIKDVPGTNMPKTGDYIEVHLSTSIDDSVIFESKAMNNGEPVQFPLQAPAFKGDLVEGLSLMTAGDEAIFRMSVDTVIKAGSPTLPWMKPGTGQKMAYRVNMISVKTMAQMQQEQAAKMEVQQAVDDKILQEYFTKNNIKPAKLATGLYYTIDRQGKGELPKTGQKVTVNYTGKLMDGEVFDSNVDPKFQHVSPFEFVLGQGQVIKGWDQGVAQMKKGTKATLYIPSQLAYGPNGQGPIKPNSILIFDVEVTDIK